MKLRNKIFISILILSLTTLFASSYYLINKNHLDNVAREQERSLNELEFIGSSLEKSIDTNSATDESLQLLLSHYADFYAKRGISLMLYHNLNPIYEEFNKINSDRYSKLLTVTDHTKQVMIIEETKQHYILASGTLSTDNYILIYARSINDIYQTRTQSIYLTLILTAILIMILSFLSYRYSRWMTKPIEKLNQGANAISNGDYFVRIDETKNEFNELGMAFNTMANAVEVRTSELEEKAKELQQFIDDLSHEMNTPLTSIQGYSEFLIRANASEEQKQKAAETIRTEAKRMKDIYTKLLALSFAREHDLELAPVQLDELFSEIMQSFLPQLQEREILLDIKNSNISINIDRTLIYMLLSNLVKNSIQAVHNNGLIQMSAYQKEERIILEVSDNGCGIPQDKIDDVLKPFFRVDKSRSRKTGGAGLGLSICSNIASLHHAQFEISSELGKGTTIQIIF